MPELSPNAILTIIRGVPNVPQDSAPAGIGVDSINLLDPLGFSCDSYDIQIPNLKNNAVWAENPSTDGRTLQSQARGNLRETLRLQLNAGSLLQMGAMLSKLGKFRAYANAFWVGGTQDSEEPVYLKHQIEGEPGPRYALLYDIEIDIETPIDPGDPHRLLTVVIEREPYWRGLAPGDNPKKWTIENVFTGQNWDASKAGLVTGQDHLVFGVIDNCQEFLTASSFQSRNFVDISADKLPGDAPPLLCVAVSSRSGSARHLIGATTNRTSITNRSSADMLMYNSLPMSSGTMASGTAVLTTDTTRGIAHVPTSALKRTVVVSPAGATEVTVVTWNSANFPHFNPHVLRGKYAVFLRASQIGGTAGAITARLIYSMAGFAGFDSGLQPVGDDATSPTELNYLGVLEIPEDTATRVSIDGKGYYNETGNVSISLSTMRSTGTGTIRLVDLVFMPLGNYIYLNHVVNGAQSFDIYDDTSYLAHGKPEAVAVCRTAADVWTGTESTGRLSLTPGVNNRLYFLEYGQTFGAQADTDMTVRLNVVPRWTGFRDK